MFLWLSPTNTICYFVTDPKKNVYNFAVFFRILFVICSFWYNLLLLLFFCCIAFPPFFGLHISFVNNLYYYCCQTLFRIKMLIIHSFKSNVQIDRELKYIIPQNSQVLSFLFIYTQVAHIRHHNVLGLWYDSLLFYYIKTI